MIKIKKRIASALLMLLVLSTVYVQASGAAVISCDAHATENGSYSDLDVHITGNPGVASWLLELSWDQSAVRYDSITYGQAYSAGTFIKNSNIPGKLTVMWYSTANVTADDLMFTVRFKPSGSLEGSDLVSIACPPEDIVNENGERVVVDITKSASLHLYERENGNTNAGNGNAEGQNGNNQISSGTGYNLSVPSVSEISNERTNDENDNTAQPELDTPKSFADVNENDYFYDAVNWAVREKITSGISENEFRPNGSCTRAQAVTFLWRAAGSPEPSITGNLFSDVISDEYYYKAVMWAVENEITLGMGDSTFSPDAAVTRAQLVTFLWRSTEKEATDYEKTFLDVSSSDYFAAPVSWAVKHSITFGTSENSFSPNVICSRGQTVTFLYRFKNGN